MQPAWIDHVGALNQKTLELTMRNDVIVTTLYQDDLALIVEALSAYQHNASYRNVFEKMRRQQDKAEGWSP